MHNVWMKICFPPLHLMNLQGESYVFQTPHMSADFPGVRLLSQGEKLPIPAVEGLLFESIVISLKANT